MKKKLYQIIFFMLLWVTNAIAGAKNIIIPTHCSHCSTPIVVGASWNYVLKTPLNFSFTAQVYDIDGFNNSAETVAKIHAENAKAICYLNAGAWESWRSDAAQFPDKVKGRNNGWRGEKWLDIRQTEILLPIMSARVQLCKQKGFDAVEFDNVDAYQNKTGFLIKSADQFYYNALLANLAHQSGLAVGLKNDVNQIESLLPFFDFAINEQCFKYKECQRLKPFIAANKAVLQVEYGFKGSRFCTKALQLHFSSIRKNLDLDEPVVFCH